MECLLSLFRNVCAIQEERQNFIYICSCIGCPIPTTTQNAIHIAIHCLLESCILGLADVLEKEDGFKQTEKEDMDTESKKTVVPFFTGAIVTRNRMIFGFGDNGGYRGPC